MDFKIGKLLFQIASRSKYVPFIGLSAEASKESHKWSLKQKTFLIREENPKTQQYGGNMIKAETDKNILYIWENMHMYEHVEQSP